MKQTWEEEKIEEEEKQRQTTKERKRNDLGYLLLTTEFGSSSLCFSFRSA